MVETFGMAAMLVLAFFVLAAVYILMRLLGRTSDGEKEEEGQVARRVEKPAEMSDEEFIESYTGPMLEDALENLEMAVESIKSGLYFYGKGVCEEAGGEFHLAVKSVDNAAGRLKEVVGMVEDPDSMPARLAKARLEECRRLRVLAIKMEEACDARVEGKEEDAKKLDAIKPELEKMVDGWRK